jgi:sporulation protein YlmC with PRC-barrel domain
MEMTYVARLRYLDVGNVNRTVGNLDGLEVYGSDARKIGDVDGFIIDPAAGRAHYIVIDSGGWFTSRRLLLPIGHATLAVDRRSLQADVTQEALRRFPEYDEELFRTFSDDELRAFERNTVLACCPDEPLEDVSITVWGYDSRRHYVEPEWWRESRYAEDRLRPLGASLTDHESQLQQR